MNNVIDSAKNSTVQPAAPENKITQKDLRNVFIRWLLGGQIGWNYERMQGLSYCFSMIPVLKKLYKDPEDMKKALKLHLQFFNTSPFTAPMILGVDAALEEKEGMKSEDAIVGVKTGLMGPFAGIGDSIFGVIAGTVFGSIAAYMGQNGIATGVLIWFIYNLFRIGLTYWFIGAGYKQGVKIVANVGGKMKSLTSAANILGLTVVGALIPTVIKAQIPLVFTMGKVTMQLQSIFDQIMPCLIPVALVGSIYWLLGKKKMTSVKAIWIVLVLGIIFYNLKLLA
jgi:PTS system mannose-specific IID component